MRNFDDEFENEFEQDFDELENDGYSGRKSFTYDDDDYEFSDHCESDEDE